MTEEKKPQRPRAPYPKGKVSKKLKPDRKRKRRFGRYRRRKKRKAELSKSVGAVVLNPDNKVLLLFQNQNKYWEFPKGKVEARETELQTLSREIEEETGITRFQVLDGFREVMYYEFQYEGRLIRREVVYFLIKTADDVVISDEHAEMDWLTFEETKKRLKHKNQVRLLDQAVKRLKRDNIQV